VKYILCIIALLFMGSMAHAGDGTKYSYSLWASAPTTTFQQTGSVVTLPETLSNVTCEITTYPTATTAVTIFGGGGVTSNGAITLGSAALITLATTGSHAYTTSTLTDTPVRYLQALVTTATVTSSTV
jgi:hypothetical protein